MHKPRYKEGKTLGNWKLEAFISAGGNGEVWKTSRIDEPAGLFAIKILFRVEGERNIRFRDEVEVLRKNSDLEGLLPIIDYHLNQGMPKDLSWYVMPLAQALNEAGGAFPPQKAIEIAVAVAKTLSGLHERGISHRDIKPNNILIKGGLVYLSDFGLVDFPGKEDITVSNRDVGAKWTIAPEMQRNPKTADGKKADVYSLAKTLWILLTKQEMGFEGQYSFPSSIALGNFISSIFLSPLDVLLQKSTDHSPEARPNIASFIEDLLSWREQNEDFEKRSLAEWVNIQKRFFPSVIPKTTIWDNINDIVLILDFIGKHKQINHTLFPSGGGLDLEGAKLSVEPECIELKFNGQVRIVSPRKLVLESFRQDNSWNFFWLETDGLKLLVDPPSLRDQEGLTEVKPGFYTDFECFDFDDFNGERLPSSARTVTRVAKGSFLICLKTGVYNSIPETYDARHNKGNHTEFRDYIERSFQICENRKKNDPNLVENLSSDAHIPQYVKSTVIRKSSRLLSDREVQMVRTTIAHFKEKEKEDEIISKTIGINLHEMNFSDDEDTRKRMEYYHAPKPKRAVFWEFLKGLTDGDLAVLEATMYGGRDFSNTGRACDLNEMLESLEKDSRESRIHSITGKGVLEEYLLAGIKAYT